MLKIVRCAFLLTEAQRNDTFDLNDVKLLTD